MTVNLRVQDGPESSPLPPKTKSTTSATSTVPRRQAQMKAVRTAEKANRIVRMTCESDQWMQETFRKCIEIS